MIKELGALALSSFLFGCAHYDLDSDYKGPKKLPKEIVEKYNYKKSWDFLVDVLLEDRKKFDIRFVTLINEQNNVSFEYYDIGSDEKNPVIMVLPISGGNYSVARPFAKYFAKKGFPSVMVYRDERYRNFEDLEMLEEFIRDVISDHRLVLDWTENQEELSGEVGVFGVSLGAIKGSVLSALDKRIDASFLGLVGGDLPYILTNSKDRGVKRRRELVMKKSNLTKEELYEKLVEEVETDPMEFAKYIDARNTLVVLGKFDNVVFYKKGKEFVDNIGGCERIVIPTGHYTSVVYMPYMKRKALKFFKEKFDENSEIRKTQSSSSLE